MINLYSGTPGSGKSLHQARNIYYRMKFGKAVVANYAVDVGKIPGCKGTFVQVDNQLLTPDFLIRFSREYFKDHRFKEGELQVYIDEAQLLFNARSWDMKGRDKWIAFFTQHRKFGYDVYLVAQFDRMLDRQIRSLIEYEYVHRKVGNFGAKGKVLSLMMGGHVFVSVKVWYPLKEKVGAEFFRYHKKFARIYDTYKLFDEDQSAQVGKENLLLTTADSVVKSS